MKFVLFVARAFASGFLGFLFPRILVAAGFPLDQFIVEIVRWLPVVGRVLTSEQAVWTATVIFSLLLFGIESWLEPISSFFRKFRSVNSKQNIASGLSCPSIILVEPEYEYQFFFEPMRNLTIFTEPTKHGKAAGDSATRAPRFRVKNIGDVPVENLKIVWNVSVESFADKIERSETLQGFDCKVARHWIEIERNSDGEKRAFGYEISDESVSELRFLVPQIDNESYVDVDMPNAVFNYIISVFISVNAEAHRSGAQPESLRIRAIVNYESPKNCPHREFSFHADCWRVRPLALLDKMSPAIRNKTMKPGQVPMASWGQIRFAAGDGPNYRIIGSASVSSP
jgi:hypothetical protein